MKTPIHLLSALLVAVGAAHSQTPPATPPPNGQLTLSLRDLWQIQAPQPAATPIAPPAPPVAAALLTAHYSIDLKAERPELQLELVPENFTEQWQLIPVADAGLSFASDAKSAAALINKDGILHFMTRTMGPQTLVMRALLSRDAAGNAELRFRPVIASQTRLTVANLPEDQPTMIDGAVELVSDNGVKNYHIPSGTKLVQLRREIARPILPSTWSLQSETLVLPEETALAFESRILLTAMNGSAMEAAVWLPAQAREIKIESPDLHNFEIQRVEGPLSKIFLRWQTRDIPDRSITIRYRIAQAPLGNTWTFTAPHLDKQKTGITFVLRPPLGAALRGDDLMAGGARKRLPTWIAEKLGTGEFFVLTGPPDAKLDVEWLPRIETASAVITNAMHTTRIVGDGAMLTEASYEIAHEQPIRWQLSLPEKSQLLACEVDGAPVQPVAAPDGALEFALPADKKRSTKIGISYTGQSEKLDPVAGQMLLRLPQSALFAHQIDWAIALPSTYEIDSIESNLEFQKTEPAPPPGHLLLRKRLSRDEQPVAELYYRKQEIQ